MDHHYIYYSHNWQKVFYHACIFQNIIKSIGQCVIFTDTQFCIDNSLKTVFENEKKSNQIQINIWFALEQFE